MVVLQPDSSHALSHNAGSSGWWFAPLSKVRNSGLKGNLKYWQPDTDPNDVLPGPQRCTLYSVSSIWPGHSGNEGKGKERRKRMSRPLCKVRTVPLFEHKTLHLTFREATEMLARGAPHFQIKKLDEVVVAVC